MKRFYALLALILGLATYTYAQTGREVHGMVVDSTKQSLPGSTIKLTSELTDNATTIADATGKFSFNNIKGNKLTLTISSIGFEGVIKHFTLPADGKAADVGSITLKAEARQLGVVTVVGTNPVTLKEDTVEYRASAYKVRANSPVEDQLKRIPGVDVDAQGNVSAQGKQITKVRINGKDFFGGDVQTATKNLPADLVDSYQIVDDYGDQANVTGIKTGEPNKILNITIRKDKNYGYFGQATAGEGNDALPKNPGVSNDNRYVGLLNIFKFNNDQQIAVLGNLNNTNVNTFSFGSATGGGGGGGNRGGGFGGGGGGRGNAGRGSSGQTSNQPGINNTKTIGTNFRDQWGKVSVYGSYSFEDKDIYTVSQNLQTNTNSRINPVTNVSEPLITTSNQNSTQTDNNTNHRLTWNMEYRPDTINYFKFNPTFSYSDVGTNAIENLQSAINNRPNLAYVTNTNSTSSAPNYGATLLYNHRFNGVGRNLSINGNFNSSRNFNFDNPVYTYDPVTVNRLNVPINQLVNTYYRSINSGVSLSYIEPLSKVSFLEFNYAYNHTFNRNDNRTDTVVANNQFNNYPLGTSNYDYTFTTHRIGLNYRFIKPKYNITLGAGVLPSKLDGSGTAYDVLTRRNVNPVTDKTTLNFVPTARFSYNFSRSQALNFNYNGSNNQPSYNQLVPVINFSNALYPVQGNPNLNPEFTNSFNLRYNKFSFETGNIFFTNLGFTQTNNKIVTTSTVYPVKFTNAALAANPSLNTFKNTIFSNYMNVDGYYQASGNVLFAKPWAARKYTLLLGANVSYTNNLSFTNSVDSNNVASPFLKNTAKNIAFAPNPRFRINILDKIDLEAGTRYTINKTTNSLTNNQLLNGNTNIRTLELTFNGKHYLWKDWTLSYDFARTVNYGYSFAVPNPNVLNAYLERRFLKQNAATIRLQGFDLFNQNTGFSFTSANNSTTQSQVNRLGRYFLLTFTYRLQKFAGRAPAQNGDDRGGRRFGGGGGGMGGPGGGGPGGPTIY
ncbi:outer membrane beta-barrel protein [Mucilaginibacter sp. PAMB04274]|uniref:outer membrane beta-barrel protein n=1 Tax=Mucilaginibacter sp. PAMB04274 TaxID=3138568 RepID=UPI0031F64072